MNSLCGPFPAGGIYCTGNMVLDILARPVEAMPPWGTTMPVEAIEQHLGGNGAITAYTLGKLAAPVRLAGAVGDDVFGQYLLERLRSVGVDLSPVRVAAGIQTATTVGLINRGGERLFLHVPGASAVIAPEQIRFDAGQIRGFSYFHFASMFHMPKMRQGGVELLARARSAGLFTSFDTVWDTTGRWMQDVSALCPYIDCLFVNQDEARMLTGSADPEVVGRFFRGRGVRLVVLKMGENGCAVCARQKQFLVPAYEVTPVDSTGAGDCFCGAFLAALRRGFPLREAARFANAVAAHSILRIGGAEGVAGFEETRSWMATAAAAGTG